MGDSLSHDELKRNLKEKWFYASRPVSQISSTAYITMYSKTLDRNPKIAPQCETDLHDTFNHF